MEFGTKAEQFMKLHPTEFSFYPSGYSGEFNDSWRGHSDPKDIARALLEFEKIAQGELESITLVGGGGTGCLAAIARWLFAFTIIVQDDKGSQLINDDYGKSIYTPPPPGSKIQVRFILTSRLRSESAENKCQELEASQRVVRLQDVSEILFTNDDTHKMNPNRRLEWEHCLSLAFGSSFHKLKRRGTSFGNLLGCASRIFKAIAGAEPEIDDEFCKHWFYYMDAAGGLGFVQNIVSTFNELKPFEISMQQSASWSFTKAQNYYYTSMASISGMCGCLHCTPSSENLPEGGFCLVCLSETILKIGLVLSNVTIEPGLRPRRVGLNSLYDRQPQSQQKEEVIRQQMESTLGPIVYVIEPEREPDGRNNDLYSVDHRIRRMIDGALLFTVMITKINHTSGSAFSRGGVCAFRWVLRGLNMRDDSGCSLARIHIIPGRILWKNVAYDEIRDYYYDQIAAYRNETNGRIDGSRLSFGSEDPQLVMEIQDSIRYLSVSYRILNSKGDDLYILPTDTANLALEKYGLVYCSPRPDHKHETRTIMGDADWHVQRRHGREVAICRAETFYSIFAALAISKISHPLYITLINKCVDRAVRKTLNNGNTDNPFLIVSFQCRTEICKC